MAPSLPFDNVHKSRAMDGAVTPAVGQTARAWPAGAQPTGLARGLQPSTPQSAKKVNAGHETSSNEDDHSLYGTPELESDGDETISVASTPRKEKRVKAKPKGKAPSKTTPEQKKSRGGPAPVAKMIPDSPASPPPAKRAKTSHADTLPRGGPTFLGPPVAVSQVGQGQSRIVEFSSTIYVVKLENVDETFHAHESALLRSTKLAEAVFMAQSRVRRTQNQIIHLPEAKTASFKQLINYLYTDELVLHASPRDSKSRMTECFEVMSLAKYYNLPGLQKEVLSAVSRIKLPERVDAAAFLIWSEDMYYEEINHVDGPFTKLFQSVAPGILKRLDASHQDVIAQLAGNVGTGGQFAIELMRASLKALESERAANVVKAEALAAMEEEELFVRSENA